VLKDKGKRGSSVEEGRENQISKVMPRSARRMSEQAAGSFLYIQFSSQPFKRDFFNLGRVLAQQKSLYIYVYKFAYVNIYVLKH